MNSVLQQTGELPLARPPKDPLRPLSEEEQHVLEHVSHAPSQPAVYVSRTKARLSVASGQSYTQAARVAGYRVGDTLAELVSRFNMEGLAALLATACRRTPCQLWSRRDGAHPGQSASRRRSQCKWHSDLVTLVAESQLASSICWSASRQHLHDLACLA